MKIIDTKDYLDTLCNLALEGKTVSTVVTGGSMLPFLSGNRDYVFLKTPEKKLKKGDIVLFNRNNGDYVLHRIKRIRNNSLYLIGDRQYKAEGPVDISQVRCVVTSVKRKNKTITTKNLIWKFYSKIWINLVFLRPVIFKLISVFCKKAPKKQ